MTRPVRVALGMLAMLCTASRSQAEEVVVMMSTQDVEISSNYTGARVALFGSIERDASTIARAGKYEIAVTVAGPASGVVVRSKEQLGPLWVNRSQRRYEGLPGFFALATTGPIAEIANDETRRRRRLGLGYYFPQMPALAGDDEAREAIARLRKQTRVNVETERGVTMPRPNLFSAVVNLPASAPTGRYVVSVNLLSDGIALKTAETSFVVRKIGFEAYLAAAARDNGVLYGLFAAVSAIFFGFLGNIIFRRD